MDYNCKNCANSSDPYEFNGEQICECRINPPASDGFPIVRPDAWCKHHEIDTSDEEEPIDMSQYVNIKNKDGSITTIYVPETLGVMYLAIQELTKEVQRLKEMHPNDHPK